MPPHLYTQKHLSVPAAVVTRYPPFWPAKLFRELGRSEIWGGDYGGGEGSGSGGNHGVRYGGSDQKINGEGGGLVGPKNGAK